MDGPTTTFSKSQSQLGVFGSFKPPYKFVFTSELSLETKSIRQFVFSIYISFSDRVDVSTQERIERLSNK